MRVWAGSRTRRLQKTCQRILFPLLILNGAAAQGQTPISVTPSSNPLQFVEGINATAVINAAGGTRPATGSICYTWSISGFSVPGLQIFTGPACSPQAQITGTATAPGNYSFSATVTDGQGGSLTAQVSLIVRPKLQIVTQTLPDVTVGVPYSAQIVVQGGITPYVNFQCSVGLPGLSCNGQGQVSGTYTLNTGRDQTFSCAVDLMVRDSSFATVQRCFDLRVKAPQPPANVLKITTTVMPDATVGQAYSFQAMAINVSGAPKWSAIGLPAGLMISQSGLISGTPTGPAGTFQVKLGVGDNTALTDGVTIAMRVLAAPTNPPTNPPTDPPTDPSTDPSPGENPAAKVALTTLPPLGGLEVGKVSMSRFEAKDGVPPYRFSAPILSLPPGMTVNPDGTYAGVPTKAGDYQFQVTVTDARGDSDTRSYTQTVTDVPTTFKDAPGGFAGEAYVWKFPGTEQIEVLSKPDWLTFDLAARLFGGIPPQVGTYDVKLRIRISPFTTVEETYRIRIVTKTVTPLEITTLTAGPGNLVRGQAAAYRFESKGGEGTVTFTQKGSGVPGMTLLPSGAWTGTPTQAGTFPLTVTATDSKGTAVERTFQVVVTAPGQLRSSIQQISINKPFGSPPLTLPVVLFGPGPTPMKLDVMVMPEGGTGSPFEPVREAWATGPLTLRTRADLPSGATLRGKVVVKGTGVDPIEIPYSVGCQLAGEGWNVFFPFDMSNSSFYASRNRDAFAFTVATDLTVTWKLIQSDARAPNLLASPRLINAGSGLYSFQTGFNPPGVAPGSYRYTVRIETNDGRFVDVPFNVVVDSTNEIAPTGATTSGRGITTVTAASLPPGALPPNVEILSGSQVVVPPAFPNGLQATLDEWAATTTLPPGSRAQVEWRSEVQGLVRIGLAGFSNDPSVDLPDVVGSRFTVNNSTSSEVRLRISTASGQTFEQVVGPGQSEVTLPQNIRNSLQNGDSLRITGTPKESVLGFADKLDSTNAGKDAASGSRMADACSTQRLHVFFARPQPLETMAAGQPAMLRLWVYDNCGNPVTQAAVDVSFGNGDAGLRLLDTGGGRYSGSWMPIRGGDGLVEMIARASKDELSVAVSSAVTIVPNPSLAILEARSIVSGASFQSGRVRAPGEFVSLFGANLAPETVVASGLPLPPTLAGASLTFNGKPVPLLFVSPGQINAVLPYGLPEHNAIELFHERNGVRIGPIRVATGAAQPAVFTRDQSGKGQGIILDPQFRFYDAANPGQAGGSFVIYASGLGEVDPPATAGEAASSTSLHRLKRPVKVTVGGVEVAGIAFAGLAPGLAGVYQINGLIPPGVTAGNAVPVTVTVDGQESPAVTMAIQ